MGALVTGVRTCALPISAFSPRKSQIGGKGLGRFTRLKAFDQALVKSTFRDDDATLHNRDFVFDQSYDLDERGLPKTATAQARGTAIHLSGLRDRKSGVEGQRWAGRGV